MFCEHGNHHTTSITSHRAHSAPPTRMSHDQYYFPLRPQRPSHLCVTRPVLRPTTPPVALPPVCHTTSITSHHAPSVPPTCVSHDQYYVPPRPQWPSHPLERWSIHSTWPGGWKNEEEGVTQSFCTQDMNIIMHTVPRTWLHWMCSDILTLGGCIQTWPSPNYESWVCMKLDDI